MQPMTQKIKTKPPNAREALEAYFKCWVKDDPSLKHFTENNDIEYVEQKQRVEELVK